MNVPSYYIDGLMRQGNAADARAYLGVSGGAVLFSAGALSSLRSDITFSNSNGVSFGLSNNGVLTASVAPGAGAGTGFTSATTPGTNIVGTLGAGGLSLGIPAYLTTAQPPGAYLTTAMASNAGSNFAGTNGSIVGGSFTLNSSGATISLPAYLTTAQPPGAYLTTAALSQDSSKYAGTGFSTATTAGTNIVGTLSNNGLSMGIPAYLTTAAAGTGVGTNTSTVTTSGTNLTFAADTNGISIAYPDWLTTAAAAGALATLSYYQNIPVMPQGNTSIALTEASKIQVVPFILPQAISASFLRIPSLFAGNQWTASGTSVNTSFTFNFSYSSAAVIYTQMTGANSNSLGYYTSSFASFVTQISITAGATGSNWTMTWNVTYPTLGGYSNFNTNVASTSGSYVMTGLTLFQSNRMADIPFALSLSAGNYWLALGQSFAIASNAGPQFSQGRCFGYAMQWQQAASTFGNLGIATNTTNQMEPGLGYWSTNAAVSTTATINIQAISITSSSPKIYFQLLRSA